MLKCDQITWSIEFADIIFSSAHAILLKGILGNGNAIDGLQI